MDGNGRWAKKSAVKVALGHQQGVEALRTIVRFTSDIGIPSLSLYAFSTENWSRPKEEVGALMKLLLRFFTSEIDELVEKNVIIRILGEINGFPSPQKEALLLAQKRTENNTGLKLNIALNYGSQREIVAATKTIANDVLKGVLSLEDITPSLFETYLYTKNLPPVDLVIRTSGEQRLSNFLLYQSAYAELSFPLVLWPDFTQEAYVDELKQFTKRNRRFGARPE